MAGISLKQRLRVQIPHIENFPQITHCLNHANDTISLNRTPVIFNNSGGRFGPNFLFDPVPEPTSALMAALGLTCLAARRSRAAAC